MSTPPPGRRHRSPTPQLVDDLIPEILLRLPPDDPACLVRASLACKPWRRILTDPGFLRRYRAFHRTPPMLGFLRNTLRSGFPYNYIARFVPTVSFRPAAPDRHGMFAIAARHGRVLLRNKFPYEGFLVWDPITDEQWTVPPLPAAPPSATRYNATVFCAAAGCDHLGCHGGPFAVAFVGSCVRPDRVIAGVYSSEVGEWGDPAELQGAYLFISYRPGVLLGNTVYFTCSPVVMPGIVEYDMARGKLSVFDLPSLHRNQPGHPTTALTVTEDGRLGFAGMFCAQLFLWSWEAGPNGAMAWKHRRNIKLETMRSSGDVMDAVPGGDPQQEGPMRHVPCVIGFADSAGVIFVRTEDGAVFSFELKSGRARETSLPGFPGHDPLLMPYMSFYTPVAGPSMKSLQIDETAISGGEFLGDNNKQVDLGGDVDVQMQHSGVADKRRLMGVSVDEQRQVWDAIDEQQKLKNQEERRQKQGNKKRKLELEVRRKELEKRRKKSAKIQESKMIRAEGRGSRSARKLIQRVTKSPLGRLPLVRSPGVNMLRSPLGVLANVAASKRGRSPSARDERPPLGKRAKSSVRSPCMSKSQSPTTSPLGGSKTINSRD